MAERGMLVEHATLGRGVLGGTQDLAKLVSKYNSQASSSWRVGET